MYTILHHEEQFGRYIPPLEMPDDLDSRIEGSQFRVVIDATCEIGVLRVKPIGIVGLIHTIFYIPGTASKAFCVNAEKAIAVNLASTLTCQVIVIFHRLSYEHKYPVPLNDLSTAIQYCLDHHLDLNINPKTIAIGGYSSGGFLAIQLCLFYLRETEFSFQQLFLISPLTSLSMDQERPYAKEGEFFFTKAFFERIVANFVPLGRRPSSPTFSPIKNSAAEFKKFPPTTIVYGEKECITADILTFSELLQSQDVNLCMIPLLGRDHDFPWEDATYMERVKERVQYLFDAKKLNGHDQRSFTLRLIPIENVSREQLPAVDAAPVLAKIDFIKPGGKRSSNKLKSTIQEKYLSESGIERLLECKNQLKKNMKKMLNMNLVWI